MTLDRCERLASHRCSSGMPCRMPPLAASLAYWSAISLPSTPLWAGTQKIVTVLSRATRREATSMAAPAQHWPGPVSSAPTRWIATRPEIAFAVSALSRYNSQPRTSHLTAAKRVLRYLRKTADHSLYFNSNGNDGEITGYTDSDWANDSADRKSQGGHVFLCNGGAISWQLQKQDLVALSTTEAEYIACSKAS